MRLFCFGELFFFFFLVIANCFIILRHTVLFWVFCHIPFASYCIIRRRKKMCWEEVLHVLQAVKKTKKKTGQSKARWRSSHRQIVLRIHQTAVHPVQMNLGIINPDKSDNYSSLLMSSRWQQLSSESQDHSAKYCVVSSPDQTNVLPWLFLFPEIWLVSTTHAGGCLRCGVITVACVTPRIAAIRHHPHNTHAGGGRSNQFFIRMNSLCLGSNLTREWLRFRLKSLSFKGIKEEEGLGVHFGQPHPHDETDGLKDKRSGARLCRQVKYTKYLSELQRLLVSSSVCQQQRFETEAAGK